MQLVSIDTDFIRDCERNLRSSLLPGEESNGFLTRLVTGTAIQDAANFLNELCIPVVLLRHNIVCELEAMSDRKRGRTAFKTSSDI